MTDIKNVLQCIFRHEKIPDIGIDDELHEREIIQNAFTKVCSQCNVAVMSLFLFAEK